MSDLLQRQTVSFVVRVWAEYQVQDPPACYGEIVCLNSGEKHLFRRWEDIASFLERQTTAIATGEPGADEDVQ